jgi:hypothetical protein
MKSLVRTGWLVAIGCLVSVLGAREGRAGYAEFTLPTDTIRISQGFGAVGSAITIEAVVRPNSGGQIYNTWMDFVEDKQLGLSSPLGVYAYQPLNLAGGTVVSSSTTMSAGNWHHVAYVYDGSQERVYIDGVLGGSRADTGNVTGSLTPTQNAIGATLRNSLAYESFIGSIDSFRISSTARYAGSSFVPTIGDLPTDASTLLLYNFNEAPGSTTIADGSGLGHTGTLGQGFGNATAPTLVPEPASLAMLACTGVLVFRRRSRVVG